MAVVLFIGDAGFDDGVEAAAGPAGIADRQGRLQAACTVEATGGDNAFGRGWRQVEGHCVVAAPTAEAYDFLDLGGYVRPLDWRRGCLEGPGGRRPGGQCRSGASAGQVFSGSETAGVTYPFGTDLQGRERSTGGCGDEVDSCVGDGGALGDADILETQGAHSLLRGIARVCITDDQCGGVTLRAVVGTEGVILAAVIAAISAQAYEHTVDRRVGRVAGRGAGA
ncbi:hypothetical protein D3C84_712510 [compost metagenome]